jgi:hypothetical protein
MKKILNAQDKTQENPESQIPENIPMIKSGSLQPEQ